jgi:hypothetical protein
MTKSQWKVIQRVCGEESRAFAEYSKQDPEPLLFGLGTTVVLVLAGVPRVVSLAVGCAVAGGMYAARKNRPAHRPVR